MDWATDLEITSKKLIPRLGRRAGQNIIQEESKSDDDLLNSPMSFSSGRLTQPPVAPPRARKTGWGDDLKGSKTKASSNVIEQLFLRDRFRSTEKENQPDDIPVIPDLDEIQEDNIVSDLSSAPVIDTNRVTAYKELDTDLIKNEAFTSLDGISLFSLTEKLYNENLVKEPDEAWNWNLLFTQIASEINNEAQKTLNV
ncbi:PREDICTED: intraflagellar transport protein 43 homolog isoform X2 [Polistes dominula]|uniref:Intraflagellar transport protein 43 homolog isoform X2 n=1 Tax=Polistes dominula TaxID=743375 RepID=A0ABM1IL70_POLDO|nr:PREDICTED: intraflagellar transport protein 43 homolog isoform X2 [Polistes dominula]